MVTTTSAASEEAVTPLAPMATPTSARASAGASLMPSPTMIVGPAARSAMTTSTLSAGVHSPSAMSTPSTAPTLSATSVRSPDTITTRSMPLRRSSRIVRAASGRVGSSSRNAPIGSSSMATKTVSAASSSARRRIGVAHRGSAGGATHAALPTATARPAMRPRTPLPGTSSTLSGIDSATRPVPPGRWRPRRRGARPGRGRRRAKHLIGRFCPDKDDLGDGRPADRQRAGLVQQQHPALVQSFQRQSAFDDHAARQPGRGQR